MESKLLSVDRIENGFAVCEMSDGKQKNIPLSELPPNISEGDVLEFSEDKGYIINKDEEKRRRKDNFELQKLLFEHKGNKNKGV